MSVPAAMAWSRVPASHLLGRKIDSIPFSAYHVVLIVVLGFVGFIEGFDLALSGSLLVLAKGPLQLGPDQVRALAVWPTFAVVLGGFAAAAMSDRISRVAVMQIGVVISTLCTLLILMAQDFNQLMVLRLITGIGLGFAISAPFPIAAELMPAQHRRTYAGNADANAAQYRGRGVQQLRVAPRENQQRDEARYVQRAAANGKRQQKVDDGTAATPDARPTEPPRHTRRGHPRKQRQTEQSIRTQMHPSGNDA